MVNADRVSTTIDSWQVLKDSGATITIGDVVRGASAQMAVLSCAYALGGGMDWALAASICQPPSTGPASAVPHARCQNVFTPA